MTIALIENVSSTLTCFQSIDNYQIMLNENGVISILIVRTNLLLLVQDQQTSEN